MTAQLLAGVDIGGTSVKVGLVDAAGRVVARAQQQIPREERAPELVVGLACALLELALKQVGSAHHVAFLSYCKQEHLVVTVARMGINSTRRRASSS